jgi:hypothetical protein
MVKMEPIRVSIDEGVNHLSERDKEEKGGCVSVITFSLDSFSVWGILFPHWSTSVGFCK